MGIRCTYGRTSVWLLLCCATRNCCRLEARSAYTIQLCTSLQCHFFKSHIIMQNVYVFSCNLPPAILAEWPGSFGRMAGFFYVLLQ